MMENRSFQKMAKKYSSVLTIFLCAIFLTCVFGHRGVSMASQNEKQQKINSDNLMVQMEYYQYNVCASCHPEDDFFAVVSDTISPIKQKYPYEIAVYNTFRAEDKKRFEKRLQELRLKEADVSLPALIMISEDSKALVCLSGLDEIKEKLEDTLKQAAQPEQFVSREAALESDEKTKVVSLTENESQNQMQISSSDWKEQLREAVSKDKSTDSVILYFSTVSCTDCSEVKSLLKKMTDEQTTKKPLVIHEFNIAEGDNVVLLQKLFSILLYVVMTIIVLIVLLPVLHIIAASFSDPQAMISGKVSFWPKDFTLRGYEAVFTYKKFWTGFRNSLFYMVFGTFINIVMTLLCAYPLSRKEFTARNKVAMFFVFTMYFSGGMVPSFMLVNALGLVDTIWAMLIPGAMSTYNMIIARTYMINSIPDELYEAAEIDGCTPFKYLIRIVVPLSKPIIAVLVLYYGVARWNSYQDAILYLQKANYLQPLQIILREILIMNDIDETMMGNADALARQRGLKDLLQYSVIVIASVPVMIIYPFVQKYFVKGVMIGAVKG